MMSPDSVLSLEAEEEAGGEVFQVINAHLRFFSIIILYLADICILYITIFHFIHSRHLHFSIIILYILCCILYTALPFYSTRLHYLLHIARFHSVCTGDFIVHSTILSVWYRITVLHITLKYTVLHRITLH